VLFVGLFERGDDENKLKKWFKIIFSQRKLIFSFDFAAHICLQTSSAVVRCKIEQNYRFSSFKISLKQFFSAVK